MYNILILLLLLLDDEFNLFNEYVPINTNTISNIKSNENLFHRRTNGNSLLNRKKVRKSMLLAEDQISKLENVYKYINKKNFMTIILRFLEIAYKHQKYTYSNAILKLLINSNKNK